MCAGKIIARVFDRVRTHHQKFTARVRRVISARSSRAEAAQGLNARRKAQHRLRAFERNATRDSQKLGLMPFEIARPGHRISVASQECGDGAAPPSMGTYAPKHTGPSGPKLHRQTPKRTSG